MSRNPQRPPADAGRRRSPRGLSGGEDAPAPAVPQRAERGTREASAPQPKARKQNVQDSPSSASASTAPPEAETPTPSPADDKAASSETNGDKQATSNGTLESPPEDDPASEVGASGASGSGGGAPVSGAVGATSSGAGPESAAPQGEEEEAGGAGTSDGPAAGGGRSFHSRREAFAQVARARGAHFARPDKPSSAGTARAGGAARGTGGGVRGRGRRGSGGAGTDATADGGSGDGPKEMWPGPFAEARRLMDNREAAAALRESIRVNGKAQAAPDEGGDSDDEADEAPPPIKVEWEPKGKGSRKGKSRLIPSLFRLCLNLLADNFDHIESLGDVSPEVRNHLAAVMCRELKLTTEALRRLSEPGVTEIILPDCSRIEPDQMRDSLLQCRRTLRVLRLGTCGRCVGDNTLSALVKDGGLPRLEMASLAGTYQLTDAGVLELLACCPRLTGLELSANSRITVKALEKMVDTERPVGMALTSLSLADCIQLGTQELDPLKGMACLERLSLSGLTTLTDDILLQVLEASGWRLRHLDISDCTGLTDASLRAVGQRCGVLESFSLGMCPLLTNSAIQELFQYSGSSIDASKGFRAPASSVSPADVDDEGDSSVGISNGKGKHKEKGKGKGKGKGGEEPPATADAHGAPASLDQSGDGNGGEGTGHAMLKSRLTNVSLRGLVQVDDRAVSAMAAACSGSLRSLDLKGLALVTDTSLVALARYCSSSLESLDLSFCRVASDDGLGHLVDASPNLTSLRLWGCTQVTDRFLRGHRREDLVISRY